MTIIAEREPDSVPVQALINTRTVHASGKGEAVKKLFKGPASKALIGQDPDSPQPRQLTQRPHTTTTATGTGITILNYGAKKVIELMPRLEEWILETCRRAGVDIQRFGLPANPAQLHDELKTNPSKLKKLLPAIQDTPRILALKNALKNT